MLHYAALIISTFLYTSVYKALLTAAGAFLGGSDSDRSPPVRLLCYHQPQTK
ncbi:hypothetical protein [Nostoc sp.]|uniref:hypothetical protein n=1 Tax=Nostoc sp. TaxID=1180 RepID=UPI0035937856